jgi:hypothetical protein
MYNAPLAAELVMLVLTGIQNACGVMAQVGDQKEKILLAPGVMVIQLLKSKEIPVQVVW